MDIKRYFESNNFVESLVLEFVYQSEEHKVTLVCDYANDVVQALLRGHNPPPLEERPYHRDLRRLTFSGVQDYKRVAGPSKQLLEYRNNYFSGDHGGGVVIQGLKVVGTGTSDKFKADIYFGDFGRCIFNFLDLQVDRRLVRATGKQPNLEEWSYIDVETLQVIDFYHPFDAPSA